MKRAVKSPVGSSFLKWKLKERVKELKALHKTALLLNHTEYTAEKAMKAMLKYIPYAWQYPEITTAKIVYGNDCFVSRKYKKCRWAQRADFILSSGKKGLIEVGYVEPRPDEDEGPFLKEERLLINSLAVMLRTFIERKQYMAEQNQDKTILKELVRRKTGDLEVINRSLRNEILARKRNEKKISAFQSRLRNMAVRAAEKEEMERREIASDLHDHLGQALAVIKIKAASLQGNSVFSGMESELEQIKKLAEQAVQYTRNLTFELSPPVAYELDLGASVYWLAEYFKNKYRLKVLVDISGKSGSLEDSVRIVIFKALRELLMNVVKHSKASSARVTVVWKPDEVMILVRDEGAGFKTGRPEDGFPGNRGYGLMNIRERLAGYGGDFTIESSSRKGTTAIIRVQTLQR